MENYNYYSSKILERIYISLIVINFFKDRIMIKLI